MVGGVEALEERAPPLHDVHRLGALLVRVRVRVNLRLGLGLGGFGARLFSLLALLGRREPRLVRGVLKVRARVGRRTKGGLGFR